VPAERIDIHEMENAASPEQGQRLRHAAVSGYCRAPSANPAAAGWRTRPIALPDRRVKDAERALYGALDGVYF
tara:strand:- start:1953 stop:2171 length:219 start_codon:yes stop_codon:yes gene_type:complete